MDTAGIIIATAAAVIVVATIAYNVIRIKKGKSSSCCGGCPAKDGSSCAGCAKKTEQTK